VATKPKYITAPEAHAAAKAGQLDGTLRKGLVAAEVTAEKGRLRVCISTADVDRDNDTISMAGWELGNYLSNPVVLWAHDHRSLPVGKAVGVSMEGGKLVAEIEFAGHAMAQCVKDLYEGGFMRAFSVGFRALEWNYNEERGGIDFKRQELLEFSTVPVPANPHALVAASVAEIDLAPVSKWMDDMIAEWPGTLTLTGKAFGKVAAKADEPETQTEPAPEQAVRDAAAAAVASIEAAAAAVVERLTALAAKTPDVSDAVVGEQPEAVTETPAPAAVADPEDEPKPAVEAAADTPVVELCEGGLEIDDDVALELGDAAPATELEFDAEEFRALLAEATKGAMQELARDTVQRTLNHMRGRLD
jgi:HK97 family phage prohead protease